jgi:CRP-like cAMP-binding protein
MVSGLDELGITDDAEDMPLVSATAGSAAAHGSSVPTAAGAPRAPEGKSASVLVTDRPDPKLLEKISLFAGLLPVHLERVAKLSRIAAFGKNQFVFKHGDPSDGLYLVLEGAIRISRNVSGIGEEALAILREGQHFGEMSIIDDDVARSADAIVHENARLLHLPKEDLRDLMFVDRELAYELLWRFVRTLAGRLRESNDRLMMLSVSSKF